jgi:hypothetical protein
MAADGIPHARLDAEARGHSLERVPPTVKWSKALVRNTQPQAPRATRSRALVPGRSAFVASLVGIVEQRACTAA